MRIVLFSQSDKNKKEFTQIYNSSLMLTLIQEEKSLCCSDKWARL